MKKLIMLSIMTILLASCGGNNEVNNNGTDVVTPVDVETKVEDTTKEVITEEELDKELDEIFNSIN